MNGDCNICINGKLPSYSASCVECGLLRKNYKPMTNADRIRSMSDEKLAEWLAIEKNCSWNDGFYGSEGVSKNDLLSWLKAPVEEG